MMHGAEPSRRYSLADISERLFNRALAVTRAKAEVALGVMGPRLNVQQLVVQGEAVPIGALTARAGDAAVQLDLMPGDADLERRNWETGQVVEPYEVWNGAAILRVRGSLMAENGLDPMSGATGYDGLSYKLRHARANKGRVRGLIADIDSPGGEVVDLMEFCAQLREAAAEMPVRAIVRGMCASAGYAIAACAHDVTAPDYAIVGSIGCIMMHADFSKALEKEGVNVTMIASGEHKTDFNQFEPLPADVQAWAQSMVDDSARTFIAHVAECRRRSVDEITAQQAQCFTGQDALDAGLISKIMPWDASMKEFAQGLNGGGRTVIAPGARTRMETKMEIKEDAPALDAAAIEALKSEAATAATTVAQTAERERVAALFELDAESSLSEGLKAAIADGTTPGAFAIALHKAGREAAANAFDGLKADATAPAQLPTKGADAGGGAGDGTPVNRGAAYAERRKAQAKA